MSDHDFQLFGKKGWMGRIDFVIAGPAGRRYHITLDRVPGTTFAVARGG